MKLPPLIQQKITPIIEQLAIHGATNICIPQEELAHLSTIKRLSHHSTPWICWLLYLWKFEQSAPKQMNWEHTARVTRLLRFQLDVPAPGNQQGTRATVHRVARRWLYFGHHNALWLDVDEIECLRNEGTSHNQLPRPASYYNSKQRVFTSNYYSQEVERIYKMARGQIIFPARALVSRAKAHIEVPGKVASDISDPLIAVTCVLLQEIDQRIQACNDDQTLFFLLANLLGIFHAIHLQDSQNVCIEEQDGPLTLYYKTQQVEVHLCNGFFPQAECWRSSHIRYPMHPCLIALGEKTVQAVKKPLKDCRGTLQEIFKKKFWPGVLRKQKQLVAGICKSLERKSGLHNSLHRVHSHIEILLKNTPVPVVSIFEGKPVPGIGYRGPCSYCSVTNQEMIAHYLGYVTDLSNYAGVCFPSFGLIPCAPGSMHGAISEDYEEFVHTTEQRLIESKSYNDVVACYSRFCALLGIRQSTEPPNLLHFYRAAPVPHLLVADKSVNEKVSGRPLPIIEGFDLLLKSLKNCFPQSKIVPYRESKGPCQLSALPIEEGARLRQIIRGTQSDARQPGRTAFYNALRKKYRDERTLLMAMGHAPQVDIWDWDRPETLAELYKMILDRLTEFFCEYKIPALAKLLAEKIQKQCA